MNDEIWVAIYCRLSDEDRHKNSEEDDSQSIQNQKSMLIAYALNNNWSIYKIYSDDDFAGSDRNRPAWNEMIRDAEQRKFQIVLCKSQSRFTREMEMVEHYLHEMFPLWGIRFIGLVDNADTQNKGNKKARQINGLINEWYLEDLSENIKEVLRHRHEKGIFTGAFAPYGYAKDPEQKGHLIPDPDAAEVVHRIFEMFAGGMGKSAIARKLNEEGIVNPTAYKLEKGIRWKRLSTPRSSMWQYFSVSEILINEAYIGNLVQGKYASVSYKTRKCKPCPKDQWIRVENTHQPIIERQLWDRVQDIVNARSKAGWQGEVGMFARKTKCIYCGYTMESCRSDHRRYLRCSSKFLSKDSCKGGFISENELKDTVLEELHKIMAEYLDIDAAAENICNRDTGQLKKNRLKKEIANHKKVLDNLNRTIKTLYSDRVAGVITPEDFARLSEDFRKDISEKKARIAKLEIDMKELEAADEEEMSKQDIIRQCMNITELNFDLVNTLIDYIEVGKRDGHYRNSKVPVVIHWNF